MNSVAGVIHLDSDQGEPSYLYMCVSIACLQDRAPKIACKILEFLEPSRDF